MSDIRKQFLRYSLVILALFVSYHIYYINEVTLNIGWLTWFEQTPRLEKAFEHTLTISDLFTQYGEHGMFGYNCLAVFNAKYFALNTFFDAYTYLAASLLCAVLILWRMPLPKEGSRLALWLIASLFGFLWFTTTQKSAGGMDTQVRLSVCFVVFNIVFLDKVLGALPRPNKSQLLLFTGFFVLSLITFGTLYSFGWVSALLIVFAVRAIEQKTPWTRDCILLAALAAGSTAYLLIYPLPSAQDHDTSIRASLITCLTHPIDSYKFLAAYLGSGILGRSTWSEQIPHWSTVALINGSIVAIIYIVSISLFFFHKVYKSTWIPLFLMLHTIGVGILILLGRSAMFGWLGGTNEWYGLHHKLGLTGITLLPLWLVLRPPSVSNLKFIKPLYICVALYTLPLMVFSEICEWKQTKHSRDFFSGMISYAQNPSPKVLDDQGNTPMKASYSETIRSLNFYKKYRLNIFKNVVPTAYGCNLIENGYCPDERVLGTGWYAQEDKSRWIAKQAVIYALAGPEGTVLISGYAPDFQQGESLEISPSNGAKISLNLNAGLFQALVKVRPNELSTITLSCSRVKGPDKNTTDGDRRELGLIINNINCY